MELTCARCAGLELHKDTVVACLRIEEGGRINRTIKTFGTMTIDLRDLQHWLVEEQVTHVAMEATGVYWKPVCELLSHGLIEASFVPPQPIQELRALTRDRRQFHRETTQHVQRIQKVLQDANIK